MQSKEFPVATWLGPPASWTPGRKAGQPSVIVIHTTEGSEGPLSAENGAGYDRRRDDGTSTHFFVDSNSIVQMVYTYDEAHAARAHGNDIGIQIEVCGKAGQTGVQWNDAASAATLDRLVVLAVNICRKFPGRFPVRRLTPAQVRAGQHGFCGHVDITKAFPEDKGTHTDPGTAFPWATFLGRVQAELTPPQPPQEDDVQFEDKYGDEAWPNRSLRDRLKDDAKLRDVLWGDQKGTQEAALNPNAPLAKLIATPAKVDQLTDLVGDLMDQVEAATNKIDELAAKLNPPPTS